MRIAYLANTVVPSHIASSIHIVKMCNAFVSRGHEVTLFLMRRPDSGEVRSDGDIQDFYGIENKFPIISMPVSRTWHSAFLPEHRFLKYYLRVKQFDLVYARDHGWEYYRVHKLKKPFVLESHILHDSPLLREMLKSPDFRYLTVISDQLRADYLRLSCEFDGKIRVFRDGADPAKKSSPIQLSRSGRPVCGFLGNLFRGKGVELILRIAQECLDCEFHLFGGTPETVDQWKQDPLCGGLTNVHFHGFVPHGETDAIRASCDFLIAPYSRKVAGYQAEHINLAAWMSPLKIFEYMSAGKPILTSDLPVLREVLQHERSALFCDPDDVRSWVEAIQKLMHTPTLASRLAITARNEFEAKYTWHSRAGQILDEVANLNVNSAKRAG